MDTAPIPNGQRGMNKSIGQANMLQSHGLTLPKYVASMLHNFLMNIFSRPMLQYKSTGSYAGWFDCGFQRIFHTRYVYLQAGGGEVPLAQHLSIVESRTMWCDSIKTTEKVSIILYGTAIIDWCPLAT